MWLPEPVYKSLPTLYALMGALFIIGVFYVGLDAPMSPVYLRNGPGFNTRLDHRDGLAQQALRQDAARRLR